MVEYGDLVAFLKLRRLLLDKSLADLKERQLALEEARFHQTPKPLPGSFSSLLNRQQNGRGVPKTKTAHPPPKPASVPPPVSAGPPPPPTASLPPDAGHPHPSVRPASQPSSLPASLSAPLSPSASSPAFSLPPEIKAKVIAAVFPPTGPFTLPNPQIPENTLKIDEIFLNDSPGGFIARGR